MKEDDAHFEPVPGLPEALPAGEHLLWQGRPEWKSLARRSFHVVKVAVWFLLLMAWHLLDVAADGAPLASALPAIGVLALQGAGGVALLSLLAWLGAGATMYSITNRRVVLRIGVALPLTVNIPFRIVGGASVCRLPGGAVDLALELSTRDRIGWLHLWPHARAWHLRAPQPMMRSVADPAVVDVLANALRQAAGSSAVAEPLQTGERRPQALPDMAHGH